MLARLILARPVLVLTEPGVQNLWFTSRSDFALSHELTLTPSEMNECQYTSNNKQCMWESASLACWSCFLA